MRYFRFFQDDTLRNLTHHWEGELVGRKAVVFSFLKNRPRKHQGAQGAATRLGQLFAQKLKKAGL
ncbi:MAG: hypothetical protein OEW25_00985 [Nitrospira sp.]|nr:hypothetical protein [Nitrospira sp.]MDH5251872.1 hypothetical protein [Nitrospira sp.]